MCCFVSLIQSGISAIIIVICAFYHITAVPDLPICTDIRNVSQCCSTQYISDQPLRIEQLFLEGLKIELQDRFQNFENIVDRLRACNCRTCSTHSY